MFVRLRATRLALWVTEKCGRERVLMRNLVCQDVENGRIRVNYYIKELFGDPEKDSNVWNQAISILGEHGTQDMFDHPVMIKVLEVNAQSRMTRPCSPFAGLFRC